jgi:hypothetical protein
VSSPSHKSVHSFSKPITQLATLPLKGFAITGYEPSLRLWYY